MRLRLRSNHIMLQLVTLLLTLPYGWVGRMKGGAPPKLPYGLDAWVYAVPFAILGGLIGGWLGVLLGLFPAFLSARLGHGQYLNPPVWANTNPRSPEKIDFLVKLFFGKDPKTTNEYKNASHSDRDIILREYGENKSYWRSLLGMSLTGFVSVLGLLPLCLYNGDISMFFGLLITGFVSKGLAYAIGWKIFPDYVKKGDSGPESEMNEATEIGEYLGTFFIGYPIIFYILDTLI